MVGFRFPLTLTKQMQKAKNRLVVQQDTEKDFVVGLKIFRAGLLIYGVLPESDIIEMYYNKNRDKINYIKDPEINFLLEKGLLKEDFRKKQTVEFMEQKIKLNHIDSTFLGALEVWNTLPPKSKGYHIKYAKNYPNLESAKKILEKKS